MEVTKFIRKGYECLACHKTQQAPYGEGEIPHGYLGPNVLAQTVLLKYFYGLSYSRSQGAFEQLCSLKVSGGGPAQALQRLGKWLAVEDQVILKAIRSSRWIHGDETGWKIAGIGHWLWDWGNDKWALYRIRRGRGRKEACEVPGLPSDNNHAERMIRHNVIFRKISFQNMSRKEADAHEVLMSLVESLRLQGRSVLPFLKKAYLRHRPSEGNSRPLLAC